MRNAPQLITYADRLAGDLQGLRELLDGPLAGVFGGVHVLPFYDPIDGADAGFDPDDHTAVDERLGDWSDVAALAQDRDVMADVIVNHVSTRSPRFRDWVEHGEDSEYAGMFLTYAAVFPDGATEDELTTLYRPRPGLPFTPFKVGDGTKRLLWTTFTAEQVDIDVHHPRTRAYLTEILDNLGEADVACVRLDAIGYAVKTPGTDSFMTPETFDFIDEVAEGCHRRGIEVLVEIHAHHEVQIAIAERVQWVYDFALPPLVIHALASGDGSALRRWMDERPRNAVTVLDTHDGIGVIDVGPSGDTPGLLDADEIDQLVEGIHERSTGSRLATGEAASNVDLYQVNTTYLDALGGDEDLALVARLIQVFTPGIPQVYYVGLLGLRDDLELLDETGVGRDVNRPYLDDDQLEEALASDHCQRLCGLLRWRGSAAVFDGEWTLLDGADDELAMRWSADDGSHATLAVDLRAGTFELGIVEPDGDERVITDTAALAELG